MARSFLTSIDLSKNQLLNAVIQNLATAKAFAMGDKVEMLITAGHFEDLRDNQLKRGSSILSSITPINNGELVFEATSNTTITVKYKGSDGTVRSGTITLT